MDRRQKYRDELDPLRSRIISNETDDSGIFIPSDSVWGNIAEQIDKKSSDKNVILWMLLGLALSFVILISVLLANGKNDSLSSIVEPVDKVEHTYASGKQKQNSKNDQLSDIDISNNGKSISDVAKPQGVSHASGNIQEEFNSSDRTSVKKSEIGQSVTSNIDNLSLSTKKEYQKDPRVNISESPNSAEDANNIKAAESKNQVTSTKEEVGPSLTQISALPLRPLYLDSDGNDIQWAAQSIDLVPSGERTPFIIAASYFIGNNNFSLADYSGDIDFALSNAEQTGMELSIGKSIMGGISLHTGINYRRVDFRANYGLLIDRQDMVIEKENATFLVFGFDTELPSLAGGLNSQMELSTRSENIVDGSLPIQLALDHSYRVIGVPILIDFEYKLFKNFDVALSGGIQHNIRKLTIDTDVQNFASSPFTILEELSITPRAPEILPFKTNYQDFIYGIKANYGLTDAIFFTASYRVQRSIGDVYQDNAFRVGQNSRNLFFGIQYRLR